MFLLVSLKLNCSLTWILLQILLRNNLQFSEGMKLVKLRVWLKCSFSLSSEAWAALLFSASQEIKMIKFGVKITCLFLCPWWISMVSRHREGQGGLLSSLVPDVPDSCLCRGESAAWPDWWTSELKAPIPTCSLRSLGPATVRLLGRMSNGSVQLCTRKTTNDMMT